MKDISPSSKDDFNLHVCVTFKEEKKEKYQFFRVPIREEYMKVTHGIFQFLNKNIFCGYHEQCLGELLLMSTHNICLYGENSKQLSLIFL